MYTTNIVKGFAPEIKISTRFREVLRWDELLGPASLSYRKAKSPIISRLLRGLVGLNQRIDSTALLCAKATSVYWF